jgi:hypothetical protein
MSQAEAIRTLQRASEYIFSSQIAGSSRKTMRGRTELWQAMATLDECRNAVAREERYSLGNFNYSKKTPHLSLICGLTA